VLIQFFFKICLVFSLLIPYVCEAQTSKTKSLLFAVNSPGYAPYLYFDTTTKRYVGLVNDFFAELEEQGVFKALYVDSNQARSIQFVIDGKVDLYLANKGWVKQPSKLITSIPIAHHLTYLYSTTPFDNDLSVMTLADKRICTQQEFVYTGLEDSFKNNKLKRVDSSSQKTIGSMLAKGRCDFAIFSNYNATSVFSTAPFCNLTVYQSPQPTSDIDLTIVMRPELHEVKTVLDKQIQAFIANGKADASLLAHSPKPIFPKQARCK
jgi:ABC-type amino acid transport substrate-binding protein